MRSLVRLAIAALAAFGAGYLLRNAAYWETVTATFLAAGLAEGVVRELFSPPPRPLVDILPDILAPLVLAGIMLLAVRAVAPGRESAPLLPALVWPLIDLWRPLRKGADPR